MWYFNQNDNLYYRNPQFTGLGYTFNQALAYKPNDKFYGVTSLDDEPTDEENVQSN